MIRARVRCETADRRADGRGSDDSYTKDYEPSIRRGAHWRHLKNTTE